MVKLTENDKTLVVPAGLGNFGQSSGSGGSGMTPEEVQGMIDTSIDEYDTEIQVDIEDLSDRISGNTENIAELSGVTSDLSDSVASLSGTTSSLVSSVDNLAGAVTALTEGVESLSGQTTANTQNIEAVSGAVETFSQSLSGYTTTDTFNTAVSGLTGQISGLSEGVAELSAFTSGLSFTVSEQAQNIEHLSGATEAVEQAVSGKQDALSAGNGIEISGATISVKAGEGLGFSGDTLVVSGASSNTKVVMLNKLSQQERLDLYNELSALYDYNASGWSSAYTEDMYAFYLDLRSYADQDLAQTADKYEGFYPMECCRMHPTDYGGAAFFTGVEQSREGNGNLICIRFIIDYEGNVDGPSTWWNNPPGEQIAIATVSFGNDGRGGLTYDADNGYFIYDSNNVATGDTQNYCEDLIDYLFLTSLFNRNGKYENYYLINVHSLDVVTGGTTYGYTAPTLSIRDITPYTIGDYTFEREVTFKYSDWVLRIDVPDVNIGANLRISAV